MNTVIEFSKSLLLERYQDLLKDNFDIVILWGGRYSGKTFNIQTYLKRQSFRDKHKMVFCRKVKDTVKDSMFDGFVHSFERHNLTDYFDKKISPTTLKTINGTLVLCRGFDDPMKIKGIEQPTIGWIEEADQCTETDFDMLFTTLRHETIKPLLILSFNPEVDINGKNWIIDRLIGLENIENFYNQNVEFEKEIVYTDNKFNKQTSKLKILSIHTTYKDNKHCPPQMRMFLEDLKTTDINKWNVWANGRLGQKEVKKPFFVNYDDKMLQHFDFDPKLETWISFDFNVAPCTATISQQDRFKTFKRFLYEVRIGTAENKSDIYDVCEIIKTLIPKNTYLYVTGDATGKNATAMTKGNLNAYDIIKSELNLSIDNFYLPSRNIAHSNSHTIVNKALRLVTVTFNHEMKYSILDMKFLEYENGKILKAQAEKLGRGHLADCIRYDLHMNFHDL